MSDYVSKNELQDLLPDQQALENKIQNIVEIAQDELWEKINKKLKVFDQRIMTIRNEFDREAINKLIDSKAAKDQVQDDFKNHEFKIGTLDKNLIAIA